MSEYVCVIVFVIADVTKMEVINQNRKKKLFNVKF